MCTMTDDEIAETLRGALARLSDGSGSEGMVEDLDPASVELNRASVRTGDIYYRDASRSIDKAMLLIENEDYDGAVVELDVALSFVS